LCENKNGIFLIFVFDFCKQVCAVVGMSDKSTSLPTGGLPYPAGDMPAVAPPVAPLVGELQLPCGNLMFI